MLPTLLFISFLVLLVTGMPIFAALGLSAMLTIMSAGLSMGAVPENLLGTVMKYNLLAVPMFMLTGVLLERSGIAKRLLTLASAIVGNGPGALAVTAVLLSMLMGGITGSASAICATVGAVMTSAMIRSGYPRPFIAAVVGTSSATDILVPPSVTLIVYSIMVPQASIPEMFAAGIIPGALCGLALIVPVYLLSRFYGFGSDSSEPRPPFWRSLKEASLGLFAKVVIIGGLRIGIFTPTEGGVIAVCYALILGCFVYRTINLRKLYDSMVEASELTGIIMVIVAFASAFGWTLSTIGFIDPLVTWITHLPIGQYGVLTILVVVLSIAGIFLEGLPIFTIFLPLVVPIANVFHWNMVWFGIVMCYMVMIGMFTPFMSVILMIAARIANTTIESTTKWVSWMFVSMLTTLVAIVAFPQIVLWLPDMLQR